MKYFKFDVLGNTEDNQPRKLRFSQNDIADLEELTEKNIFTILQQPGPNTYRLLVWAGLKWQEPALTPGDVGELIQKYVVDKEKDMRDVLIKPLMHALRESKAVNLRKKEDEEKASPLSEATAEKTK